MCQMFRHTASKAVEALRVKKQKREGSLGNTAVIRQVPSPSVSVGSGQEGAVEPAGAVREANRDMVG